MCYLQKTSSQQFHSLTFFCKCWMHDNAVVSEISRMTKASLNDRYVNQQGDIPANIRLDEDVLKTSFVFRRSLDQDKYIHPSLASSEDVLVKTNIFILAIRLQDVFNTSCQDVFKTFSRRLKDFLQKCLQDIFKASSRRFADVFKTYHQVKLFLLTCL